MTENQKNQSEENKASERLQLLLQRAAQGDREVLSALRECLDAHPEIWQEAGNLAVQAERVWISMAAGSNLVLEKSLKRQLEAMRAELSGPTPSPLDKLLVDQVVQAWLQTYYADILFAQKRDLSKSQQAHLQRRQDQAQKRYLATIKALATMRKLLPKGEAKHKDRPESSEVPHGGKDKGSESRAESHGTDESREPVLPEFLAQRMHGLIGSEN